MASDKTQFRRASEKWYELHRSKNFSLPNEIGKMAIICSYYTDFKSAPDQEEIDVAEIEIFRTEALALADREVERGWEVDVALNADGDDFKRVLTDPDFSTIITIGHGSFSHLYMPYYKPNHIFNNRFDWQDIAEATDHLKTGLFVQRHCGHSIRQLSVPLGAFGVTKHSNVYASQGLPFTPQTLDDAQNEALVQITEKEVLTYTDIKKLFPFQPMGEETASSGSVVESQLQPLLSRSAFAPLAVVGLCAFLGVNRAYGPRNR